MNEKINTFLLSDPETLIPMDRDEFYHEQIELSKKGGEPTRACEIVNVFLFTSARELIIQKRSNDKMHNAGLLDKSIGGHVTYGDSPNYTVQVETVQELQTPSIVLKDKVEFLKTLKLLNDYTKTLAIIRHLQTQISTFKKVIKGKKVLVANKAHVYLGLYNGSVKPVDREAKGILFYDMDDLKEEMRNSPELFTDDLHVLVQELEPEIKEFLSIIG
jgi:isopentenyldiphosphate isomerase